MKIEMGGYEHYLSSWWGLEDGTLLDTSDDHGNMYVEVNGDTMTVEDFNRMQEVEDET